MKERDCSCLVKTRFVSVGRAKPRGLKRRLGIGQDAVLGPRPRRRFKSRNARLPRRRVHGRAGRRKSCAHTRNISLLRIVWPTVRISDLPCTAERLTLCGQAFSPGGAAIIPRPDSTPPPYHKSFSHCQRFFSPCFLRQLGETDFTVSSAQSLIRRERKICSH